MTEKFPIKTHHALMLMPFHENRPRRAGNTFVVDNPRLRHEEYLPASLPKSHAPIQVFTMHEILIIQHTYLIQSLLTNKHTSTRNCLNFLRLGRQWRKMQVVAFKQPGISILQAL